MRTEWADESDNLFDLNTPASTSKKKAKRDGKKYRCRSVTSEEEAAKFVDDAEMDHVADLVVENADHGRTQLDAQLDAIIRSSFHPALQAAASIGIPLASRNAGIQRHAGDMEASLPYSTGWSRRGYTAVCVGDEDDASKTVL